MTEDLLISANSSDFNLAASISGVLSTNTSNSAGAELALDATRSLAQKFSGFIDHDFSPAELLDRISNIKAIDFQDLLEHKDLIRDVLGAIEDRLDHRECRPIFTDEYIITETVDSLLGGGRPTAEQLLVGDRSWLRSL